MDPRPDLVKAILVSHAVIILLQWLADRCTTLGRAGAMGIYFVLLPVGFNLFGADLPPWLVAGGALSGVGLFMLATLRPARAARPAARNDA